jgi:hypothetical protein
MHCGIEHARRISAGMAYFDAFWWQIQRFRRNESASCRETQFPDDREGESIGLTTAAITALATVQVKNVSAIPA